MAELLDIVVKASVLLIAAGAGIGLMRRASAASRHLAWTAVLCALVMLPFARLTLPAWTLFVLPAEAARTAEPPAAGPMAPVVVPASDSGLARVAGTELIGADLSPTTPAAPVPARLWPLSTVLVGLWMAGAAAMLLKATVGAMRARQLARQARPAGEARLLSRLAGVVAAFGVRRPVALLISAREWMPATWGILRPAILLPASATGWLDRHPDRLDAVLVHETAHIARFDAASQVIARLAAALHWFNPLVWLAVRQARLERERACDDAVLARGLRPSEYAGDLLALAQSLVPPALTSSSALAMARRSQLDRRIQALLDHRINRRGVSRPGRLIAAGLVFAMLPVAAARLAARPAADPDDRPIRPDLHLPAVTAGAQAAAAETVDSGIVAQPVSAPQATPTPQAAPSPYQFLDQSGKWFLERGAMARQLAFLAQSYLRDVRTMIEIGTTPPIDVKGPEQTVAAVEQATAAPSLRHGEPHVEWPQAPTDAEITAIRTRFTDALRSLDAAITRFAHGLVATTDVDAAFKAAVAALTDPPAPPRAPGQPPSTSNRFVTRSGTNTVEHRYDFAPMAPPSDPWQWKPGALSDADLIAALKNAAAMPDDTERADMLLLLTRGYAFTPEMVAIYVAAANGITSDAERARVFAQPIRVKPGGPAVVVLPGVDSRGRTFFFLNQADNTASSSTEFAKGTVPENTPGLTKPVARAKPLPKYTAEAMRAKIQGEVLVDVVVGTDGTVLRARIAQSLDPDYGLDESALATAKQWTFEPGVLTGEKVPVLMRLTLTFTLH